MSQPVNMSSGDAVANTSRSSSPALLQKPTGEGRSASGGRGRASHGRGGPQVSARGARAALGAIGGRMGAPETRSDTRGRWGKAPLPQAPPPAQDQGGRQLGVIVTVRETFGFIKCLTQRRDEVFFHGSELGGAAVSAAAGGGRQRQSGTPPVPELGSFVQAGTHVEFTIVEGSDTQRTLAVKVDVLPSFLDTMQTGAIERELRGGNKHREEAYGGRISWTPPAPISKGSSGAAGRAASDAVSDTARPEVPPGLSPSDETVAYSRQDPEASGTPGQQDGMQTSPQNGSGSGVGNDRQPLLLSFEGSDLAEDMGRLQVGQPVTFLLTHDRRAGHLKAAEVALALSQPNQPAAGQAAHGKSVPAGATPMSSGKREMGHVVTLKENFGFLLSADSGRRLFFHFSEAAFPRAQLVEGAEVAFGTAVDESSGREAAVALQLLAPGAVTAAADVEQPGTVAARVVRAAQQPRSKGVQDGVAAYAAPATGLDFHCAFGAHQLPEGVAAAEGDEVTLKVIVNERTGARRAASASLLSRLGAHVEFGKVVTLKSKWGLVRAVGRPLDVFFNYASLVPPLTKEDLAKGTEVQFTLSRNAESHKLEAVGVSRAPEGSAVFETVGEEELLGTVVARLTFSNGATAAPGLLEYIDPTNQLPIKLPFGLHDLAHGKVNPGVGDPVTFRVAVNHLAVKAAQAVGGRVAMHAGRRATQVSLPVVSGTIVNVKPAFAFADLDAASSARLHLEGADKRVYFQTSEVADRVQLRVGDTVEFVVPVDPRSGKRTGHRVRRTAEASSPADGPDLGNAAAAEGDKKDGERKKPEFVAERNPNAVKYTGHKLEMQTMREPKGPDGTAGFEPGPWCEKRLPLREPPPAPPAQPASVSQQGHNHGQGHIHGGQQQLRGSHGGATGHGPHQNGVPQQHQHPHSLQHQQHPQQQQQQQFGYMQPQGHQPQHQQGHQQQPQAPLQFPQHQLGGFMHGQPQYPPPQQPYPYPGQAAQLPGAPQSLPQPMPQGQSFGEVLAAQVQQQQRRQGND
mmetsp:Transcript_12804/g.38626  ORF Transcript_12804/g.38626 Transcript_12804/m.38626 type:complete len:1024 (-) Transcript_12804:1758-4829(-)